MSRVEELTLRLADGELTDAEHVELERLVAGDPAALRLHAMVLEIEGVLRGQRTNVDVSAAVMARIEQGQEARIVEGVRLGLAGRRPPKPRGQGWSRAAFALAAGILVVIGALALRRDRATGPRTAVSGESRSTVLVRRGAATKALEHGQALRPGDRIETADDGAATLEHGRGTLVLGPRASISLGAYDGQRPLVIVDRGRLEVRVRRRPEVEAIVLQTPHARALAADARLVLAVTPGATRLEVAEGRARFSSGGGAPVDVAAGETASAEVGAAAAALRAPASIPEAAEAIVRRSFDFEDGVVPPLFEDGEIAGGPVRPGNRYCLAGVPNRLFASAASVAMVSFHKPVVLYYSSRVVLGFDYWIGAGAEAITIQLWNRDQRRNYYIERAEIARERWAHAEVRVADLETFKAARGPTRMNEGDSIHNIHIVGGGDATRVPGAGSPVPFYVDNVELVEYPTDELPATSFGGDGPRP